MLTAREAAEARIECAKGMMIRAAQATLEGNVLADDFAWLALAELEAVRAELARSDRYTHSALRSDGLRAGRGC